MNKEEFILYCKKNDIKIDKITIENLEEYKNSLKEWNKKFNLTSIIEDNDIYLKHFFDSIFISKYFDFNNKNICDFGTGAGFPGMILAIFYRNSKVTLIESNGKKVNFLNEVKNKLKLENVTIINDRIENYAKNNREIFDIVTCRAVANLSIILELSVALLKIKGIFIPMKSNVVDELIKSNRLLDTLGYSFVKKIEYELPFENSKRTILEYLKNKKTDNKYPRNYSIIKKQACK